MSREGRGSSSHEGTKLTQLSRRGPGEEEGPVLVPFFSVATRFDFPRDLRELSAFV
jgi:hypothetical protein